MFHYSSFFSGGRPQKARRAPIHYRCRLGSCNERFLTRGDLIRHRIDAHLDPEHQLGEWTRPYPWINDDGEENTALRRLLEDSRVFIFDGHRHGLVHSIFNFPLNSRGWVEGLADALRVVRESTLESAMLNLSLGVVLRHRETGEYRYFVPAGNVPLIPRPERIDSQADWDRFLGSLQPDQVVERVAADRPNTKWQLIWVTNVRVDVYYLGSNLGVGDVPGYILNNPHIWALVRDRAGRRYEDSFCAFRALAAFRNLKAGKPYWHRLETQTSTLKEAWGSPALRSADLDEFEEVFGVCVDVYSLDEDGSVYPRYLSQRTTGDRLVLNLFRDHLSLVGNVQGYLSKYKCTGCRRHFRRLQHLKQHRGRCARSTRTEFSHAHFHSSPSIFELLEEVGLAVPPHERVFPWFATFDCESILKPCDERTVKVQWTARHELVSMSVSSNIPGFREPRCFVDGDPAVVVQEAVGYLTKLASKAYDCARERWSSVFTALEAVHGDPLLEDPTFSTRQEELQRSFFGYCKQLPVLGYNSSNYDLNLLKGRLFAALGFGSDDAEGSFVIKRNNAYTAVGAKGLRFLDITNYLAPGFSYSQFLKAYGVPEAKSYFPYEWFDDVSKLDHPSLPPYEAFVSTLRGVNVLEEGEGEAAGRRRYESLETTWVEREMETFRDFLVFYNNLDVGPFVTAVEKMQEFYFGLGVDLFKVAVSIPGVARSLLYKTAGDGGVSFSSVRPGDEDLYYLIKQNIVGGPSVIFTRHHEVGKTCIRADRGVMCTNILGYDANALYLWAIDQTMPTGDYVRRFGPEFKPVYRGNRRDMFHWLDFVSQTEGIVIWHQRNHGEVKIGRYSVDGFQPGTKTVFEYDGCFVHGCDECGLQPTEWRERKRRETVERRKWLEDHGYVVRNMKEHDFVAALQTNRDLRAFVDARLPPFFRTHRGRVSRGQLLDAVRRGPDHFFGQVEVDIEVPSSLKDHFSEMCPIFANTDVSFDDIGETMQAHARARQLPETSRRLLVGGLSAERVLLSSDLLRWYLTHGLIVTRVHQAVEYTPVRCFRSFVEQVTAARRAGDVEVGLKVIGESMKLIGNSAYGSVLMDREKHVKVSFRTDVWSVQQSINSPRFRSLNEISDSLFEVSSAKPSVRLDLPVQVGFQILQLAKLRMLQFYFDCLNVHCKRSHFEMLEMDTDSAYFGIGGQCVGEDGVSRPASELVHVAKDPQSFLQTIGGSCDDEPHTPDQGHFFPRTCCAAHRRFDSRTPGLFKLEAEGQVMIGLCSKTYVMAGLRGLKTASKGLRPGAFPDPVSVYRGVLETGVPAVGENRGFRARDNTIYTYLQERSAIAYFYCKRRVLPDGVHTVPLNIPLRPWPKRSLDLVEVGHPLWPDAERDFHLSAGVFFTLRDVCDYALTLSDPDPVVVEALNTLPLYEPRGDLVFVAVGGFDARQHSRLALEWTCGLGPRCAALLPFEKYPGNNRLGALYTELVEERVEVW